ncbi:ATP-dependent Zn protease [Decorospora gaudefroyi]|uniref:ATP-dependent Zn protease n=1 Tax=Decorospora gaudefroyi TaxID=184978 RepID=A0A6A5KL50_9PLEO|nr:ATP-dependent Zn protease [Decorospora gaudefroyi]
MASQTMSHEDMASLSYFDHSSAKRVNTDIVLVETIRTQYPDLDLVVAPQGRLNLLAYASAGFAKATALDDVVKDPVYGPGLKWRSYAPPARRLDTGPGVMVERVIFGKYMYRWKDQEAILYLAEGRDGMASYPAPTNHYILSNASHKVDELIKEATKWGAELHNEVWVFDGGYWQKSAELYNSVQKSNWESVILDEDMKKSLIADVDNFFDGQKTYQDLKVPWKRGLIYYGPPGNGKTISIKAMMHSLYQRGAHGDTRLAVPTLYVRTLSSFGGPEYALAQIFGKARQEAPCFLVFEDLDSIVSDSVRSYFLNEVDGLKANDGILMVGSTNHLDRLDPGIAKRPSRFDRKYYFPDPSYGQRVQYAKFWQGKLKDNKEVDFPDELCEKIAEITSKFSFAYMQEAFVATLLAMAARGGKNLTEAEVEAERWAGPQDPMKLGADTLHANFGRCVSLVGTDHVTSVSEPDVEKLELWIEMKRQVKILREEMEEKKRKSDWELPSRPKVSAAPNPTNFRDELDAILHGGQERRPRHLFPEFEYLSRQTRFE